MKLYLKLKQILLGSLSLLPNATIATAAASRLTDLDIERTRNNAVRSLYQSNQEPTTNNSISISVRLLHARGALPNNDNDKTSGVDSLGGN